MQYDRTVIGYHGCTAAIAEALLAGGTFKPSENEYDWLGRGVYFWEYGIDRAWQWAQERYAKSTPVDAPFADWSVPAVRPGEGMPLNPPAVVGAVIQLGQCFDLLDTRATVELGKWASLFVELARANNLPLPRNTGKDLGLRRFDCAIVNFALQKLAEGGTDYDSVRCGFVEGMPVFDDGDLCTEIRHQTHIQIAIRNPRCIVGTFRPALVTQPSR